MTNPTDYCPECPHCTGKHAKPLADIAAERRVTYALLMDIRWQDLEPMLAEWFYGWLPRMVVKNIVAIQKDGLATSLERLADWLHGQGFKGPIERELQALCDFTPFHGLDSAKEDVARIAELARARSMIAQLKRWQRELESGMRTSEQVKRSIEMYWREL